MDNLDSLLKDLETEGKKELEKRKKTSPTPQTPKTLMEEIHDKGAEALVLLNVEATCKRCGTKYTYPNKRLMIRKGKNLLRVQNWTRSLGDLPREVHTHEDTVDRCENCIHEGSIYDVIRNQREIYDRKR